MIVVRLSEDSPDAIEGPAILIAIDRETQEKLWQIPELSMDTSTGWVGTVEHIVTLDEDGTIVIIKAKDGELKQLEPSKGRPQALCKGESGDEVFLEMLGGPSQRINPAAGSTQDLLDPNPCSGREPPPEACRESTHDLNRAAACLEPSEAPQHEDIEGKFALNDGETNVLVGTDPATRTKIILMGFEAGADASTWVGPLALEGDGSMEQSSADLAEGTFYVAARTEGDPWSLFAVDGVNGEPKWNTPLSDTEESSMDRGISVVDGIVYLLDEDTLHRIDAASGKLLDDLRAYPSPDGGLE
jgi:outer membrane protein assembly factor BamB